MTATDLLADIGRALYGERWRVALARAIGVDDDTVRRWMTGRTELRADHPVFERAAILLRERAGVIDKLTRRLSCNSPMDQM